MTKQEQEDFNNWLRQARGVSESTAYQYSRRMRRLCERQITSLEANAESGDSFASRQANLAALRAWLTYKGMAPKPVNRLTYELHDAEAIFRARYQPVTAERYLIALRGLIRACRRSDASLWDRTQLYEAFSAMAPSTRLHLPAAWKALQAHFIARKLPPLPHLFEAPGMADAPQEVVYAFALLPLRGSATFWRRLVWGDLKLTGPCVFMTTSGTRLDGWAWECLEVLRIWAYGDATPDPGWPVIPLAPGMPIAISRQALAQNFAVALSGEVARDALTWASEWDLRFYRNAPPKPPTDEAVKPSDMGLPQDLKDLS